MTSATDSVVPATSIIPGAGSDGRSALAVVTGGGQGEIQLPKPFAQPICLIERTRIAGTTHASVATTLESTLTEGARLQLQREPGNLHDKWAIRVLAPGGERLGYVPCDDNEILARLMDAGKCLYAKMLSKEWRGSWLRISMAIYLED